MTEGRAELGEAPQRAPRLLRVRLGRLPDLDSEEAAERRGLRAYGRFAITRGGRFWFGSARSSHPGDTRVGWYWALDQEGTLLVSARGVEADGLALFEDGRPTLAFLVERLVKLRVIPNPKSISLEGASPPGKDEGS